MLHEKPVHYDLLARSGDDDGHGKPTWTGEKRRKHEDASLHVDSSKTCSLSSSNAGGEKFAQRYHEESPSDIAPSDSSDELALLENDIVSEDEFFDYLAVMTPRHAIPASVRRLDDAQQSKVYERLALYRTKARELLKGLSRDERCDKDDGMDWYFDPDYSVLAKLGDYQRLVLKNYITHDGVRYLAWEEYRSYFSSYDMDRDYVKCCEEISKKVKWLKLYIGLGRTSDEWMEKDCRGLYQAVKIAASYPHMTTDLALTAYMEHVWDVTFDYWHREDFDRLLFEIWKRVAKEQMAFGQALEKVLQENIIPRHKTYMEYALEESDYADLKSMFDTCVEGIADDSAEEQALKWITWAVWNKLHKPKKRDQYIRRKMEIAKEIGMDPQTLTCVKF